MVSNSWLSGVMILHVFKQFNLSPIDLQSVFLKRSRLLLQLTKIKGVLRTLSSCKLKINKTRKHCERLRKV